MGIVRALQVIDDGDPRYVTLRGALLSVWLKDHRMPAVRSPLDRGYRLHRDRLADVLAIAQEGGVAVRMRGGR